jgi:hypothetical protein
MPALVVSATLERFERAAGVLRSEGFAPVQMPAIFLNKTQVAKHCLGNEGHRYALRNAWRLIASSQPMCVFEDDIIRGMHHSGGLHNGCPRNASAPCGKVSEYVQRKLPHVDLLFLGNMKIFWANHAQCLTPAGASKLYNMTRKCIRGAGLSVDSRIAPACGHTTWSPHISCLDENINFFVQDRVHIPSYLHDAHNKVKGTLRRNLTFVK